MSQSLEVVDGTQTQSADGGAAKADAVTVELSRDELTKLISDGIDASADRAARAVGSELAGSLDLGGAVELVDGQYGQMVDLESTGLYVGVAQCGLLALVLGAVVAVGMTLHWRGSRG